MHDRPGSLIAAYEAAAARHLVARDRQRRRAQFVSYGRILTFLLAAACFVAAVAGVRGAAAFAVGAIASLAAFVALVYIHSRVDLLDQWHNTLALLMQEAAARVGRRWERLAVVPVEPAPSDHPYAEDLDLFGRASLFQLLGWVGSEAGRRTLRAWLLAPAPPHVVARRQEAVRELAPLEGFREELAALGRLVPAGAQDLDAFFAWAESPGWLRRHRWVPWAATLLRVSILGLLALQIAGLTDRPLWLYPVVVGLVLNGVYARRMHETFTRVFSRQPLFQRHAEMFARLGSTGFQSAELVELQARLARSGLTAAAEMAGLDRLKRLSDLRFQAMFHFPINSLTLWDLFVADRLERWQQRVGGHLREWFEILGEADALAAIGSVAHDNPAWAYPDLAADGDRFSARALGHPLLPDDRRVANDVEVGPPGTLLLVTGSNMSGKSTLLRAIGVNAVLAQIGAPVCADRLSMPPLTVFTSMRVQDSLEAGVSYFMAALQRLKLVVDAAQRSPGGSPRLLYLLDEILQGTNTAERQVAVRHILGHLLSLPVIGAVTTHDLELAASPELVDTCSCVHFTEGVEEGEAGARLSFDYRLRPGVATSRNALKLLRLVGLDR
jgi:hypothetical protein